MGKSALLTILLFCSKIASLFSTTDVWWQQRNQDHNYLWLQSEAFSRSLIKITDDNIPAFLYDNYLSLKSDVLSKHHFLIYLELINRHLPEKFKLEHSDRLSWGELLLHAKKHKDFSTVNNLIVNGLCIEFESMQGYHVPNENDIFAFYLTNIQTNYFNSETFTLFVNKIGQPTASWANLLEFPNESSLRLSTTTQQAKDWSLARINYEAMTKYACLSDLLKKSNSPQEKTHMIYYFYLSNLKSFSGGCNLFTPTEATPEEVFSAFLNRINQSTSINYLKHITLQGFLDFINEKELDQLFNKNAINKQIFLELLSLGLGQDPAEYEDYKNELIGAYSDLAEESALKSYLESL